MGAQTAARVRMPLAGLGLALCALTLPVASRASEVAIPNLSGILTAQSERSHETIVVANADAGVKSSPVPIDVRPGHCPNYLNVSKGGYVTVAVVGTRRLRATSFAPGSVRLLGIKPASWRLADIATPHFPESAQPSACTSAGADGRTDLVFRFSVEAIDAVLEPVADGDVRTLRLTGRLKAAYGSTAFWGEDVIVVRKAAN